MIGGVGESLVDGDRHLVTMAGRSGERQVERAVRFLDEGRIDGLVLISSREDFSLPPALSQGGWPLVLVGCEDAAAPTVTVDDAAGVAAAVRHLAGLGHRRLLWLGPEDDPHSSVLRRRAACRQAVGEAGLHLEEQSFVWCVTSDGRLHSAPIEEQIASTRTHCAAQADLLQGATAVVCYDDVVACGLYAAARGRGLSIPDDLSVVGFDDFHAAHYLPPLTTVSHMLPAIGRRASEILQEMIDGGPECRRAYAGRRERVAPLLMERGSTATPADGDSQL